MINFNNVCFNYPAETAFSTLNIDIPQNAITFLLGENGSGKSTLLKLLLGLLKPNSGDIVVQGKNIAYLNDRQKASLMSYIPQSHSPVFDYLVKDIIVMGCLHELGTFERPSKKHYQKAYDIASELNISHLLNKGYKHISGGERQLVLIARALMQTSNILIMDEPTANLDFGHQANLFALCKKLVAKGTSIILSSHNPNDALKYGDYVVLMQNRSCVASGFAKQILTAQELTNLYNVNIALQTINGSHWLESVV